MLQPAPTAGASNPAAKGATVGTRRGLRDITNVAGGGVASGKAVVKPSMKSAKPTTFFSGPAEEAPSLPLTAEAEDQDMGSVHGASLKESSDVAMYNRREADDIDARDSSNPLMVTHYVQEIYAHMRDKETNAVSATYMQRQPHINEKMRAILIDWLVSQICLLYSQPVLRTHCSVSPDRSKSTKSSGACLKPST